MCLGIFFLLLFSATACYGAKADSLSSALTLLHGATGTAPAADLPSTYTLLARLALSLGTVLLVIWLAILLLRKFSGRTPAGVARTNVRVLERTYIAPKKAVYVLQVGNRALAVGVTDTQMNTLAELDLQETLESYPSPRQRGGAPPFAHLLKDMRLRLRGGAADGAKP